MSSDDEADGAPTLGQEESMLGKDGSDLLIYVVFRATRHECLSVSNISELSSRRFSGLLLSTEGSLSSSVRGN